MHGNISVSQAVAIEGEQSLWVTWHYHMVHCTFMWRLMQRSYERGWIDANLRSYNHTMHCQKMMLKQGVEDSDVGTRAKIIYPTCVQIESGTRRSVWTQ